MSCDPLALEVASSGKDWIDYFSALLTPTIAVLGSAIALQQWRTNRKRLKHELFDRRYAQFEAIREFLRAILAAGKSTLEGQQEFLGRTRGLRFTFGKAISDYVHTNIWSKAIDLECLESELKDMPAGQERSEKIQRKAELKKDLYGELKLLEETFANFLQLDH